MDNTDNNPDDALQRPDDIYNPNRDQETLPEDNDSPATPAEHDRSGTQLPEDHPAFDSNIDPHEAYDEGELGATDLDVREEIDPDEESEPMEWDETM